MTKYKYGICIIGYKNYSGIKRLLTSIDKVDFCSDTDITLIASIDYSGDDKVISLFENYEWRYGEKIINAYNKNLGLKTHILKCGDYLERYELDAMVVLEDDIYVSPMLYRFIKQAVPYYFNNDKIAGLALYKHEYNIFAQHPFYEYNDGGDTFFVQYAMSWGQVWFRNKWKRFKNWYENKSWELMDKDCIPSNLFLWKNSWLKYHIMYCIDNDLYFVYPRQGLTTNFSDVGTHCLKTNTSMQIPMCMDKKDSWVLNSLDDTLAVYDAFFENMRLKNVIGLKDLEVDLYGAKPVTKSRYILSRKELPYMVINSWGLQMRPIEANIILNILGDQIFLYDKSRKATNKKKKNVTDNFVEYDLKGVDLFNPDVFKYIYHVGINKICNKFNKYFSWIIKKICNKKI